MVLKHTKAAEAARRYYRAHRSKLLAAARKLYKKKHPGAKRGSKAEHYRQ